MIKIIFEEIKKISIGLIVLCILTIAIFLLIGKLDYRVFLGLLLGSVFMFLMFALLGMTVEKAIKKPPKSAKKFMYLHYGLRFVLSAIVILIAFKADYLNGLCVCLPMFAPKITYASIGFFDFFKQLVKRNGDNSE